MNGMNLPSLQVGNKTARYCIVQGGMSVRIALHRLAAAVAECGGVGTIGGMGIPPEELRREIRAAKALTDGVVGVNLMYAGYLFDRLWTSASTSGWTMWPSAPALPAARSSGCTRRASRASASSRR